MVINKKTQKTVRKNTYKKEDSSTPKYSKIRSVLTRKRTIEKKEPKLSSLQKENISKILFSIVLALCIFGSIAWASFAIYGYATKSEYFAIKKIEYHGNKFLTEKELADITGLELDTNILNYEMSQIEADLLKNPWIDSVRIRRNLPSQLFIEVKEKEAVFWATKDDVLYYLDKNINFIAPVTKEKFISLPTIDIKYASEETIRSLPFFIDTLASMGLPFSNSEISWFSINHIKGYELYLEDYNLNISVAIEDLEKNIQNLTLAVRDLKKRNEIKKIKEIRSAHNQVTVVKN